MKKSLLVRLEEAYPDSSRNTLRSWVKLGRVAVDGSVIKQCSALIDPQQEVALNDKIKPLGNQGEIVYEDKDLVVVKKPPGLLSVAEDVEKEISMHRILKKRARRVYPVHRLDKGASGLLVFAYTEAARDGLKKQFMDHTIIREYRAVVEGELTEDGTWDCFMKENAAYKMYLSKEGKRAITHYSIAKKMPGKTLLKLNLETGRKNQIRLHCSLAGHPICGDKKYGAKSNPYKRLALHALRLEFMHPIKNKWFRFIDEDALSMPLG